MHTNPQEQKYPHSFSSSMHVNPKEQIEYPTQGGIPSPLQCMLTTETERVSAIQGSLPVIPSPLQCMLTPAERVRSFSTQVTPSPKSCTGTDKCCSQVPIDSESIACFDTCHPEN